MNIDPDTKAQTIYRADIVRIVASYVSEYFYIDESKVKEALLFEEDLCADPIVVSECIDALEEEFTNLALGFKLESSERADIESVADLVDAICANVIGSELKSK